MTCGCVPDMAVLGDTLQSSTVQDDTYVAGTAVTPPKMHNRENRVLQTLGRGVPPFRGDCNLREWENPGTLWIHPTQLPSQEAGA
jgi:hypothetical protein